MSAPASAAAAASANCPPSEKLSGVDVDDAHDLRLIEADGSLAELQRRPRAGQRLPLRGHVVVEAALEAFDRHQLGRPAVPFDRDQLDRGEPVEPAGEPRDLAVMTERRIDEGGRAKERAHGAAL